MDGYLSRDQLLARPDLEERDVEVRAGKLRVRELTAAQVARINQLNVRVRKGEPIADIAGMQVAKFELGVIEPKLSHDDVVSIHKTWPEAEFGKVLQAIDEISGTGEDALEDAQAGFPGGEAE